METLAQAGKGEEMSALKINIFESENNTITCCTCKIQFQVPMGWMSVKRSDNCTFYCPNGHSQYFPEGKSELDLEREKNAALRMDIEFHKRQTQYEVRSHSSTKGQMTKLKNRVKNGVCPCCNRHFSNVERHMQSKHPEYKK